MRTLGISFFVVSVVFLFSPVCRVEAQNPGEKLDMVEIAEKETERLQRLLELEDWQAFYVDSTLQHDYAAMQAELEIYRHLAESRDDIELGRVRPAASVLDDLRREIASGR